MALYYITNCKYAPRTRRYEHCRKSKNSVRVVLEIIGIHSRKFLVCGKEYILRKGCTKHACKVHCVLKKVGPEV